MARSKYNDGSKFLAEIQSRGVKGVIRKTSKKKLSLSYKSAGNDVLDYCDAPKQIDTIIIKARRFAEGRGLELWVY